MAAAAPIDAIALLGARIAESRDAPWLLSLDGRELSYGVYWRNAVELAASWRGAGASPGDVVALQLPSCAAFPACYLACAAGGFVALPIADHLHPTAVEEIRQKVPPALIVDEVPVLDATLEPVAAGKLELHPDQDSPFLIMFTAGSTGTPKTIVHSLRSVVGSAAAFGRLAGMSAATRLYHVLPMAYMAGVLNTMLAPFCAGASIVEGPLFSPEAALDFWTRPLREGVNTLSLIPPIAAALCSLTRDRATIAAVARQVVQVQCTSAPIPPRLRRRFVETFTLPLQDCYGITELGGPLTLQSRRDAAEGNDLSTPLPEIDVELREEGGRRELWIRSPFAMLGYQEEGGLVRPVDGLGFMDTGDLAQRDGDRLRITGRKKDLIIRGGVNVAPLRIEQILLRMPELADAAVVGVEHPFWGEAIVACLVPKGSRQNLEQAVARHCRSALAEHERPDRFVVLERLPRSFIGKLQRDKLRTLAG